MRPGWPGDRCGWERDLFVRAFEAQDLVTLAQGFAVEIRLTRAEACALGHELLLACNAGGDRRMDCSTVLDPEPVFGTAPAEPIPAGEASDSDFGAFQAAAGIDNPSFG